MDSSIVALNSDTANWANEQDDELHNIKQIIMTKKIII